MARFEATHEVKYVRTYFQTDTGLLFFDNEKRYTVYCTLHSTVRSSSLVVGIVEQSCLMMVRRKRILIPYIRNPRIARIRRWNSAPQSGPKVRTTHHITSTSISTASSHRETSIINHHIDIQKKKRYHIVTKDLPYSTVLKRRRRDPTTTTTTTTTTSV